MKIEPYGTAHQSIPIIALFAKDAPGEIPDWFEHTLPPHYPEEPDSIVGKFGLNSDHTFKEYVVEYWNDHQEEWEEGSADKVPVQLIKEMQEHLTYIKEFDKKKTEWELLNKQERYFQWRVFFATKLIDQINKGELI